MPHLNNEISKIILKIVDVVSIEGDDIERALNAAKIMPDSLENRARIIELKIRRKQVKKFRESIYKILKDSENVIVLSLSDQSDN